MLFPSVAKFEHHHDHFTHSNDLQFTVNHSHDCPICKFEFSSYLTQEKISIPEKKVTYCSQNNISKTLSIFLPHFYSFALRAPPCFVA